MLDPTVAASFVGLIGGALGADAVQRGRSPFAETARRGGRRRGAWSCTTTACDPGGPASAPFDGEGVPRRRTALIEDGRAADLPLRHLHRPPRRRRLDRQRRRAAATAPCRRSRPPTCRRRRRALASRSCSREAGEGVYVTDVAGLHSGVNPVSGVFSVGASGRAIRGGELAEPLREFTIAGDLVSMLRAVEAAGAEARWVPFGGSVSTPPLLIGEMTVSGS